MKPSRQSENQRVYTTFYTTTKVISVKVEMYNGMYGSPFPKLNPRVQYKTALERAGFDVNRGASPVGPQEHEQEDYRSVSTGAHLSKNRRSPPRGGIHDKRLNSMPVKMGNATNDIDNYNYNNDVQLKAPIIQPQPVPRVQVTAASSIKSQERGPGPGSAPYGNYPGNYNNNNNYYDNQNYQQNNMMHNSNDSGYNNNVFNNNGNAPMESNSYNTQNGSTFNFENPGNQYQPSQPQPQEDMNPIEKSFNMLTQNDTQSEFTSSTHQNDNTNASSNNSTRYSKQSDDFNSRSNASKRYSKQSNDFNSMSNTSNRYSKQSNDFKSAHNIPNRYSEQSEDFDTSNLEDIQVKSTNLYPNNKNINAGLMFNRDSQVKTLSFAPNDNLHVSMHADDETIPLAWNSDKVNSHDNNPHPIHTQFSSEIKPQVITVPTIENTHHNDNDEEIDIQSPVTESNTNMNVEQLIAQLDDVSFSRNEQLNPKGALSSANDAKLKKSSAYLSGFPKDHPGIVKPLLNTDSIYDPNFNPYNRPPGVNSPPPPPLPQNIYSKKNGNNENGDNESMVSPVKQQDDDGSSSSLKINTSLRNSDPNSTIGATPTFYKFNQDMNPNFYSSSTSLLLPKNEQNGAQSLNSSRPGTTNTSPSKQKVPAIKYPPGEGPCRTCGLEIVGRGIFSKKQDELSGQWHKKCFKCTECDIRFNKSTPCYILNDMPYCQQHYHEKNNSICKICHQFIEGECLENDKKERFHVYCLTCFLCHEPITQDYFIFNDEIPLCANHDMDALIADGLALPNDDADGSPLTTKENTVSKRRTRLINFQDNEGNH